MTRHELKCWPDYFAAIRAGTKTFELRKNDRGFQVGDILVIQEFDPGTEAYTGQVEERQISYLLSEEGFGFIHDYVAIGFGPAPHHHDLPLDETLTKDGLADWHQRLAIDAISRAAGYTRTAVNYRVEAQQHAGLRASAARMEVMANEATREAKFHATAARLVEEAGR